MDNLSSGQWQSMMEYLRNRHATICRQWFSSLDPVGLDCGLLRIHTQDSVQRDYLQHKCRQQFTEAAQSATGKLVTVRFETGPFEPVPLSDSEGASGDLKNTSAHTAADIKIDSAANTSSF